MSRGKWPRGEKISGAHDLRCNPKEKTSRRFQNPREVGGIRRETAHRRPHATGDEPFPDAHAGYRIDLLILGMGFIRSEPVSGW